MATTQTPPAKNTFRTFDTTKPTLHVLSSDLLAQGEQQDSSSGLNTPTGSFQGFEIPFDRRISRQAQRRWTDLNDDSSTCSSCFRTPATNELSSTPLFPVDTTTALDAEDEDDSDDSNASSPTASFVDEVPLKDDTDAADGAEAFEVDSTSTAGESAERDAISAEATSNGGEAWQEEGEQEAELASAPVPPRVVYQNQPYAQVQSDYQPRVPAQFHTHHSNQQYMYQQPQVYSGPYSSNPAFQQPPSYPPSYPPQQQYQASYPPQYGYDYQEPSQPQQRHRTPPPPAHVRQQTPPPAIPNANYELEGWVSFIPYNDKLVHAELPNAAAVGAGLVHNPKRTAKFFCGHMWGQLSSATLQWLVSEVVPTNGDVKHRLFAPQLHYNKDGWFRGCLHVSIHSEDPQEVIDALHKRVLFDHNGVWYAQNEEEKEVLATYCRKLRNLPQALRHEKLQSLPCNPIAVEFAANEH